MTTRSDFEIDYDDPNIIVVIDLNQGRMSVTNDAEEVVAVISRLHGPSLHLHRIIYRDSDGQWDGLRTKDGQFAGFVPLMAASRQEAIRLAVQSSLW